jgi:diketogulonate reductase-like aldo/keto reductase
VKIFETAEITYVRAVTPNFIYGTAWKEDRTEALVRLAIQQGFRAIDTANQRKHYFEEGVGAGLAGVPRGALWLQTKFTYARGQDHRLPYDPDASFTDQVKQSFASSLEHLHTDYLDSYVLHGPELNRGLTDNDIEVWRAMEALHASGQAKQLGVSNVAADQLAKLASIAKVPIAYVQNRCYAARGWDADVRALCKQHGIAYQGFSLLTANRSELQRPIIDEIAMRIGVARETVVFRFAIQVGMIPLTGTSNAQHMTDDLRAHEITLTDADVHAIETIAR